MGPFSNPLRNASLRASLSHVLLVVGCLLHWVVTRLSELWGRDPSLWVFGARSGEAFADNAKYLYLHVASTHPEIRPVWLSKDRAAVSDLRARGYEAHHVHSLRGVYLNLRAGAVFVTHGLRDVNLWCSGGAKAVMLWHGTALKHVSWDAHFPDEPLPVRLAHGYTHRVLDLAIVTAESMVPVFASAFRIDPGRIVATGYPRNDALFEPTPGAGIGIDRSVHRRVERLAAEHTVLLYLPTFRDSSESTALDVLDLPALAALLERYDAYLLVKTHPNETIDPDAVPTERVVPLPETVDSHLLLPYADALISDYSSVVFDYLLLDRPLVFYAHDLEEYRAERGFYFEYEDVTPGPVARSSPALLRSIERVLAGADPYADERARVRERFCHTDENRSEAVYEAAWRLLPPTPSKPADSSLASRLQRFGD